MKVLFDLENEVTQKAKIFLNSYLTVILKKELVCILE